MIGFVVKGYPRLSETFITQEILALEARGLPLHIFSLRRPTDRVTHPANARVAAPVTYLPEYLWREPLRVFRAWRRVRRLPGYRAARRRWLRDLVRDRTPNRIRRFGQALVLAADLPDEITHIHAHFLHTPASVTAYAARISGRHWTCSAHAKDIWTIPDWEKREKLVDAEWTVTCTAINHAALDALAPGRTELVYHGLDPDEFPSPPPRPESREEITIVSVGRAVEKKGHADVLAALARLPASAPLWRFVHIGGGPLLPALRTRAAREGIADRVGWAGALARPELLAKLRAADIFVLASRVARDGDRDGLPNVLLEAQSQRLPCVATRVSAIPELIEDEVTGLLAPPDDPPALAAALERLLCDPQLRARLGRAGEARVRARFSAASGADRLAAKFRELLGSEAERADASREGAGADGDGARRDVPPRSPASSSTKERAA